LRSINAFAPILKAERSMVSVDNVLNVRGFDLQRTLEMDPEFLNTDQNHTHDATVSSHSITESRPLDMDEVQNFIREILVNKGADMYRMKGVLNIADAPNRFVYQGVHMIFSSSFDEAWGNDECRDSKLVFIGKDLDKDALTKRFQECILTPEIVAEKREKLQKMLSGLRFKVGTAVECATGGGIWSKGEVVALLYRQEGIQSSLGEGIAPYQIKLTSPDRLIYAPSDDDRVIRLAK